MLTTLLFALLVQEKEDVWIGTVYPETHPPVVRNRIEFTKKFEQIEEGMTMAQVSAVLGLPDDVVEEDERDWGYRRPLVIWKYGSVDKFSMPAYGAVYFNRGIVDEVRGVLMEARAWKDEIGVLKALYAIWDFANPPFNAYWIELSLAIVAANRLIALGEEGAFVAMHEYDRIAGSSIVKRNSPFRATMLAELLFERQNGSPLEKWELVGGLPFPIGYDGSQGFVSSSLISAAEELNKSYKYRSIQYQPTGDASELVEYARAKIKAKQFRPGFFIVELVSVFRPLIDLNPVTEALPILPDGLLVKVLDKVEEVETEWDASQCRYVKKGSSPHPQIRPLFRTYRWSPEPLKSKDLEVLVYKNYPTSYSVGLRREVSPEDRRSPMPAFAVYVQDADDGDRLVAYYSTFGNEWQIPNYFGGDETEFRHTDKLNASTRVYLPGWTALNDVSSTSSYSSGRSDVFYSALARVECKLDDRAIRLTLEIDGKTYTSQILKP